MKRQTYIYFIKPVGEGGPIKIGCSYHPEERLLSLSTWSPFPLEVITTIPGDMKLEKNIHNCFADLHSHREWFRADQRLIDVIELLKRGTPVEEAIDLKKLVGNISKKNREQYWWNDIARQKMSVLHRVRHALIKIGVSNQEMAPLFIKQVMGTSGERLLSADEAEIIKSFAQNPYPYSEECMTRFLAWKEMIAKYRRQASERTAA